MMVDSEKKAILCPNCRRLVSSYETKCPYCGMPRPGSRLINNPFSKIVLSPDLIRTIIVVNVVMFVISLIVDPMSSIHSMSPFSLLSPSNRSLFLLGATGTIPIDHYGLWWSLVSANYLHGGIFHILFNMIALYQIAPFVVQEYGTSRMFLIYTLSGIIGFYISYLAGIPFTIGASASITGLIGCALYYGKSRGGAYGQTIYRQVGGWAVAIFLFGFLVPGINNWGHAGGMVAGAALGFLFGYQEKKRENIVHKTLALALAVLTVLILCYAVLMTFIVSFS
jgi:rhomboid protease GluP